MSHSVITKDVSKLLEEIAKKHLGVSTLDTRNMDGLDFYDVAIWEIKKALEVAYQCGMGDPRIVK
jgi:hypothetical protein